MAHTYDQRQCNQIVQLKSWEFRVVHLEDSINVGVRESWHTVAKDSRIATLQEDS